MSVQMCGSKTYRPKIAQSNGQSYMASAIILLVFCVIMILNSEGMENMRSVIWIGIEKCNVYISIFTRLLTKGSVHAGNNERF